MRGLGGYLLAGAFALTLTVAPSAGAHGTVTHVDPPSGVQLSIADLQARQAGGPSIPDTWCGPQDVLDDTAHELGPLDAPKIKTVILVAPGRTLEQKYFDMVQNHVRIAYEHIRSESGGRKSIRFDLGTSCGPGFADIAVLRGAPATMENPCPPDEQVSAALDPLRRPFNYLIFIAYPGCEGGGGQAQISADDSPGAGNEANVPGRRAMTFGDPSPNITLHEIAHTLGAVQLSAPHTDATWHCWDLADVMCYPYTGAAPESPLRPCAFATEGLDPFDCGKDDYFNPEPAPGSYLATHWNLYNSVFLCEIGTCVPPPPAPAAAVPAAVPAAPAVTAPAPAAAKPAAKRRVSRRCRTAKTRAQRQKHKCPPKRRARRR